MHDQETNENAGQTQDAPQDGSTATSLAPGGSRTGSGTPNAGDVVTDRDAQRKSEGEKESASTAVEAPGFVYLIGVWNGCHKIGLSINPDQRVYQVGSEVSEKLTVIHRIKTLNMRWLEYYFHEAFKSCRVHGEWFRLSKEEIGIFSEIVEVNCLADIPISLHKPEVDELRSYQGKSSVRTLGDVLDTERKKQGISIRKLADKSNMGARRIQGVLDGEVPNPGILTLEKIIKALGRSLAWLEKRMYE